MDSYIEAKLPFRLLKRCESKQDYDPEIDDEYYKYHHLPGCLCGGSGMMPTGLGYSLLVFLKWAFRYHAWYLCDLRANPVTTMKTVIDYTTEEELKDHQKWRDRNEKKANKQR